MLERFQDLLNRHIRNLRPNKRNTAQKYLIPIVLVGSVVIAKLFLRTFVSEQTSYHLLMLIIILCAFYGGLRSGLFATVLVIIFEEVLFLPKNEQLLGLYNILSTIALLIGGVYISLISDLKHKADLQKDGFIGLASNELKRPLQNILLSAQKLLKNDGSVPPRQKHSLLQNILRQAKQSTDLINEMLDITKIETGRLYLKPEKFTLYQAVRDTVDSQQLVMDRHRIVLSGETKKKVYADKSRIEQVLINLISNAAKHAPDNTEIQVVVSSEGNDVSVAVTDRGPGIPSKDLEKVFEPYYVAKRNDQSDGLGLGLYISSMIIRRHGGKMAAKSAGGKGSTFLIVLPAV